MKKITLLIFWFFFAGCSLAPVRLFQAKVPAPVVKSAEAIEAERGAADLIARKIEKPEELIPVATKLSGSLGAPRRPFDFPTVAQSAAAATKGLDKSTVETQRQLAALNAKLAKYEGKEIEGTGFSILGPGMAVIVIGLIVLGVACPPAFTLMAFAYRRLKSTAGMVVEQIDEAAKSDEAKATIEKIKANLNAKMDIQHKRVVHALQKP